MELCKRDDHFFAINLILFEKWSSADVKTVFFCSTPDFCGKIA